METPRIARLLTLAYAQPKVQPPRRTKPSAHPSWRFDMAVVLLLVVTAFGYFAS
jgi:hypothetical protein